VQAPGAILKYSSKEELEFEAQAYEFLRDIVTKLGVEGMSEDETDDESTQAVLKVRPLYWRRNLEVEFQLIDAIKTQSTWAGSFRKSGAHRQYRSREKGSPDHRDPKPGLPEQLYNTRWLTKQTVDYLNLKVKVSDEVMDWIDFE
jgi:hypothetical protein